MKKVIAIMSMLTFVVGLTFAGNPPLKSSNVDQVNKEAKADTTKKHHAMKKKGMAGKKKSTKTSSTKSTTPTQSSTSTSK